MRRAFNLGCALLLAAIAALPAGAQTVHHLDEVFAPPKFESKEAWLGRAAELRRRIPVSTGLQPMPERSPLSPRLGPVLERNGYTIQSVALETYPGFFLTGNLYRPRGSEGPHPAVLSPHGHWETGRFEDTDLASIPGRAINFARRGYVFFSYSMVGYNETEGILPHRFSDPRYELWGFGPMGLQLWNGIRALDWLTSLPDVDTTRIGMTGASGGGTQTFMLTAIDPRVKVSAPVNMISAHMQGGCVCENAPLLRLGASNMEIGALAAPRPLLMVSTSGDWTVNTPEVEYPAVRSVYRLFDAEERVANVHLDYPHNYNRDSREAVYEWFDRWLRDGVVLREEISFEVEESSALRADVPENAKGLEELFEAFRRRSIRQIEDGRPSSWSELNAYRERFGAAYREVFRGIPEGRELVLHVRVPEGRSQAGPAVLVVGGGDGVTRVGGDAVESSDGGRSPSDSGGSPDDLPQDDRLFFALEPHPDAFVAPDSIDHWTTYNATTAARRVDEIRRAIEHIQARPDVTEVDVVARGEAGPWTLLARALVDDVRETVIDLNGFDASSDSAYVDRLFIPLLRRAGDFKTAAALIVPARLDIHRLNDETLRDWLLDVYRAVGAPEMLKVR